MTTPEPDRTTGPRPTFQFSSRRLVVSLAISFGLAAIGVFLGVMSREGWHAFRIAPPENPRPLVYAFGLALVDLWLGGLRIWILAHRLAPSVRIRDGLRADLANKCLAGITPWQTGGGAAQLYVLARAGLPASGGVALGTINFFVSTVAVVILGLVSVAFAGSSLPSWLLTSTQVTIGILGGLLLLIVVLVLRNRNARPELERLGPDVRFLRRAWNRTRIFVRSSMDLVHELLREHRGAVAALVPVTWAIFLTKFAYTYFAFRAFHPQGEWTEVIAVLLIFVLALFFAPTPGASGVAEASGTAFLAHSMGAAPSVGFVLAWRWITAYLPVIAGGVVLLHQIRRDSASAAPKR